MIFLSKLVAENNVFLYFKSTLGEKQKNPYLKSEFHRSTGPLVSSVYTGFHDNIHVKPYKAKFYMRFLIKRLKLNHFVKII